MCDRHFTLVSKFMVADIWGEYKRIGTSLKKNILLLIFNCKLIEQKRVWFSDLLKILEEAQFQKL